MKKQFKRFVEWFNSLEKGDIPNISQTQLILHIGYDALMRYYNLLRLQGCIRSEGEKKNKKYIKIKDYEPD